MPSASGARQSVAIGGPLKKVGLKNYLVTHAEDSKSD
jgi:hypothetical protein